MIWKILVVRVRALHLTKMAAKLQFGRPLPDGTKVIVKPMRFKLTVQAQRVAESIRPALEPELDRIRAGEVRHLV